MFYFVCCVYTCVWEFTMCHCAHAEVRGQLAGVGSVLLSSFCLTQIFKFGAGVFIC